MLISTVAEKRKSIMMKKMLYHISSMSLSEASWPELENAVKITLSFIGFEFVCQSLSFFYFEKPNNFF